NLANPGREAGGIGAGALYATSLVLTETPPSAISAALVSLGQSVARSILLLMFFLLAASGCAWVKHIHLADWKPAPAPFYPANYQWRPPSQDMIPRGTGEPFEPTPR